MPPLSWQMLEAHQWVECGWSLPLTFHPPSLPSRYWTLLQGTSMGMGMRRQCKPPLTHMVVKGAHFPKLARCLNQDPMGSRMTLWNLEASPVASHKC